MVRSLVSFFCRSSRLFGISKKTNTKDERFFCTIVCKTLFRFSTEDFFTKSLKKMSIFYFFSSWLMKSWQSSKNSSFLKKLLELLHKAESIRLWLLKCLYVGSSLIFTSSCWFKKVSRCASLSVHLNHQLIKHFSC